MTTNVCVQLSVPVTKQGEVFVDAFYKCMKISNWIQSVETTITFCKQASKEIEHPPERLVSRCPVFRPLSNSIIVGIEMHVHFAKFVHI